MALTKKITELRGWYTHTLTLRVVSQDEVANKSRISYEYVVRREPSPSYGAWTTLNNTEFKVVIGSVTRTATPNFDFRENNPITMMEGEVTVTHGDDGVYNPTVTMENETVPGSSFFPAGSKSSTFNINPIVRSSVFTVSPNPVTEGGDITVSITPAGEGFTHDIAWVFGDDTDLIEEGVEGGNYTFTPDENWLDGESQVVFTIEVTTYDEDGNPLGVSRKDVILQAPRAYPEVGVGLRYDVRYRRVELVSGKLTPKEIIPYLSTTMTDTLSGTYTCSITTTGLIYGTSLDETVVLAEFFDGAQWLPKNMLFFMTRVEGDVIDESQSVTYTGQAYVDYLLSKALAKGSGKYNDDTPGHIMKAYVDSGHDRGWGPLIDISFTSTRTSVNTKWDNDTDLKPNKDTPFLQILEGLVTDILAEYNSRLDVTSGKAVLDMYNPGYGRDWTTPESDPIINVGTAGLYKVVDNAPTRKDYSEKLTRVRVRGDENSVTRESAAAVNPILGHLEGTVNATGVKKTARLNKLGDAALKNQRTGTIERTYTYDLASDQTPSLLFPYRTFAPGDWILVPGEQGPERVRVSQVAITVGEDSVKATITVGDIIPSGIAATARKLTQASGGAIAGGTLADPLPLADGIPAAPLNLTTNLNGFWDASGAPKAAVELSWNPVETSVTGNSIDVDLYEVYTRREIGDSWTLAAMTGDDTSVIISPLDINRSLDLRVRARSVDGVYGEYSEFVSITTPAPDETLGAPSDPLLDSNAIGDITITWDGQIEADTPPLWFAYLRAEISDTEAGGYTPAGQQLTAAGDIVVANVGAGTWWVRLVAYDTLGVRGEASNAVDITVTPAITDTREPKAPTGVEVSSLGYWDGASALSSIVVEWTAVTEGVDDDPIDIRLYEVWGKLTADTTYRQLTDVPGTATSVAIAPIGPVGSSWDIAVLAVAQNNERSEFSDPDTVIIAAPGAALDPPSEPSVNSQQGVVLVEWDGNLFGTGGGETEGDDDEAYPAPSYVSHVDIEVSFDEGESWDSVGFLTRGARSQSVAGFDVGTTVRIRLVAYDILGNASDPSEEVEILIVGIMAADIEAGSINANHIEAGSINVTHVSPSFGDDLNLSANGSITLIAGQVADAQAAADDNAANIEEMRTRYDFTPTEAIISQPGSVFQVAISNTQLEFRESGVARAFLNAGVFNAPQLATLSALFPKHVIIDEAEGTAIRRVS